MNAALNDFTRKNTPRPLLPCSDESESPVLPQMAPLGRLMVNSSFAYASDDSSINFSTVENGTRPVPRSEDLFSVCASVHDSTPATSDFGNSHGADGFYFTTTDTPLKMETPQIDEARRKMNTSRMKTVSTASESVPERCDTAFSVISIVSSEFVEPAAPNFTGVDIVEDCQPLITRQGFNSLNLSAGWKGCSDMPQISSFPPEADRKSDFASDTVFRPFDYLMDLLRVLATATFACFGIGSTHPFEVG